MNNLQKVGKLEAVAIIIMIIMNQIILNLSNTLIMNTGSSTWINVIYVSILAVIFCLLICKLFKPFETSDIIDISEFVGGKILKIIIGILYITFFLFLSGIFLRYMANSLKLIYFKDTPLVFLLLFFIVASCIVAKLGIKVIAKVNLIFVPILLVSMIFILLSTSRFFVPQRVFPILGFGTYKTFLSGAINTCSFAGFAYLYFLISILKDPQEFKKIAVTSIIFSALYLLINVICLIMLFPFISFTDEMLSIYLLVRMIEFGRFFQRIDAVFILLWISSFLSFLSISLFFSYNIYKKLTKIKYTDCICYSFSAIIFGLSLIIKDIAEIKYVQNTIFPYVILILVFIISPVILLLANFKKKRKRKIKL